MMKQITVISRNEVGTMARITQALSARGINIDSFVADTIGDQGIFIFSVDQYDQALAALRDAGYEAVTEEAIIIKLDDKPGALAQIALRFAGAGINLRSIRIISRCADHSLVAISTDRTQEAMELVRDVFIS